MKIIQDQRISSSKKNANGKKWYKDQADYLDNQTNRENIHHIQVNYDLYNNKLNLDDFEYVCKPLGSGVGKMPARMVNRDIVSGKIKVILGMEMDRPFTWKVVSKNEDATTAKEQEEFGRVRDFVVGELTRDLRKQIAIEELSKTGSKELSEQERAKIEQEIDQETKRQSPDEVKQYMERKHSDSAEIMSHQLLEYLTEKCGLKKKFNDAFKHGLISGQEILYIGILNGEPEVWDINSLRFNCDKSPDSQFVEDGEWATCEYSMIPSDVVKYLGDELTQDQITQVYSSRINTDHDLFSHNDVYNSNVTVLHCVWKSLRKIGFLSYLDETGEIQQSIVDEVYKLDRENGDIDIDWEWIPEVYETWKIKIADPIYIKMRPIPGQFKDLDNLYHCKLPYYGAIYDNMNSKPTSLLDRLKLYQYLYNIVMYRLELVLAGDKGKKVLMNINSIPDSAGIDMAKWQYFLESTPYMWYNPSEEGNEYSDVNSVAKVIDLSSVSDIQKYIDLAMYLRSEAGRSVGITERLEGEIGPKEAVQNIQQSLVQSSHILELYFDLHNHVKKNVLQALLETAKIAYSKSKPRKLSYVLDGISKQMLNLDIGLLDNTTLGIFVSNSGKSDRIKQQLTQLLHAAMQNQMLPLSDVVKLLKQDDMTEAEDELRAAETKMQQRQSDQQNIESQKLQQQATIQKELQDQQFEQEKEKIILKAQEDRKTKVSVAEITAASFNPDQDKNNNGINDFMEMAKKELDMNIKKDNNKLQREKFEYQKEKDKKELNLNK